jgi:hypothetical protein
MKGHIRFSLFVGVVVVLCFTGCEKSDQLVTPSFSSEQEYFSSVVSNDEFFTTEEPNIEDGGAYPAEYNSDLFKEDAAIVPFRFGKKIQHVQRSITYTQEGDSVVFATVTRTITGEFVIVASYDTSATKPDTVIRKPYVETVTRRAKFVRVAPLGTPPWRGWKLAAISLLKGGTENNDVVITRLVVYLASGDSLVVASPNDYFLNVGKPPRPVPAIHPGDRVRVQLTLSSTSPDTEIVVLRHGAGQDGYHRRRARFHLLSQTPLGAGLYSRVYELTLNAHKHLGKFNAVAEAILHGSIYDDTAPLENNYWGVPYVVR